MTPIVRTALSQPISNLIYAALRGYYDRERLGIDEFNPNFWRAERKPGGLHCCRRRMEAGGCCPFLCGSFGLAALAALANGTTELTAANLNKDETKKFQDAMGNFFDNGRIGDIAEPHSSYVASTLWGLKYGRENPYESHCPKEIRDYMDAHKTIFGVSATNGWKKNDENFIDFFLNAKKSVADWLQAKGY